MRVLQIVHGFPPSGTGGAELYAERIARGLVAAGHDVEVFAREATVSAEEYAVRDEARDGFRIRWVNNTFREARSFVDTYENARITAVFDAFVRARRPDVAHVHHLTCLSTTVVDALAAHGVPVVLHLHDYWLLCHRGQLLDTALRRCDGPGRDGCAGCTGSEGAAPAVAYGAAAWLRGVRKRAPRLWPEAADRRARQWLAARGTERNARQRSRRRLDHMLARFALVDVAIAPSAHVRERFIAAGFPFERMVVSEYGVDRPRQPHCHTKGPLRIGFLGSLMVSKAPHLIAEAMEWLGGSGIEATYYGAPAPYHGDYAYSDTIVSRLTRPGARVCGPLPHREVGARIAEFDVLVFPSIWDETSGIGAREALAAGVPVVASRLGGIPEFVHDEVNGLLFAPGDARDLARQLGRLRDERGLLARLRAGIAPVRSFADDLLATMSRYEELRTKPASTPPRQVTAVVLNYQTPGETANAVKWLRMSDPPLHQIVVVDNGDGVAMAEALGAAAAAVRLIATGANLGFAGGSNAGIRIALEDGADAVLLVNSDVSVSPFTASTLSRAVGGVVGIAGPVVRNRAHPDRFLTAGLDFSHLTGRMRARTVLPDACDPAPSAVSGCAMLIERRVFERIGLLSEPYFFGFEEIEFCERARTAGFGVMVVPDSVAYHAGGATMGASADRLYYGARNHLRLSRDVAAQSPLHAALRQLAIVGYSLAHAVRASGASLPVRLWAVGHGVADYLRGRGGPRRR